MPRTRRASYDEPVYDAIGEDLKFALAALGGAEGKRVTKRRRKLDRRLDKAAARWHRLTAAERKAWAEAWLASERRRYRDERPMPKAADLPLVYAIVAVAEQNARKAAKRRAKAPAVVPAGPKPRPASAEPLAAVPKAIDAADESPKPRKRRRGPRYGVVAIEMPDGTIRRPIYDEDF